MRLVRTALIAFAAAAVFLPLDTSARPDAPGSAGDLNTRLLAPLKSLFSARAERDQPRPDVDDDVVLVKKVEFGQVSWVELRPTASGSFSTDTRHNPHFRFPEGDASPLQVLEDGSWQTRNPRSANSIIALR